MITGPLQSISSGFGDTTSSIAPPQNAIAPSMSGIFSRKILIGVAIVVVVVFVAYRFISYFGARLKSLAAEMLAINNHARTQSDIRRFNTAVDKNLNAIKTIIVERLSHDFVTGNRNISIEIRFNTTTGPSRTQILNDQIDNKEAFVAATDRIIALAKKYFTENHITVPADFSFDFECFTWKKHPPRPDGHIYELSGGANYDFNVEDINKDRVKEHYLADLDGTDLETIKRSFQLKFPANLPRLKDHVLSQL